MFENNPLDPKLFPLGLRPEEQNYIKNGQILINVSLLNAKN